jgi:hypothetical protein
MLSPRGIANHKAAISTLATFLLLFMPPGYAMDDIFPPESEVTVEGKYNDATEWYYGSAPMATFTATDDLSGVKYIVLPYNNGQCGNNVCFLQPGETLTLDRQRSINKGNLVVNYYAVDNAGNAEKPNKLSIWVDMQAPDLYVIKVKTDSKKNIPVGYLCKDLQKSSKCMMVSAKVKEKVTFQMLGSDLISGIGSIQYRVIKPLEKEPNTWEIVQKNIPYTLDLAFDKSGIYHLQLKAVDVAGNESAVKDFWIRVS